MVTGARQSGGSFDDPFCCQLRKLSWELGMWPNCADQGKTVKGSQVEGENRVFPKTALWKESRNSQGTIQLPLCWEHHCSWTISTRSGLRWPKSARKSNKILLLFPQTDGMHFWSKHIAFHDIWLTALSLLAFVISLLTVAQCHGLTSAGNWQLTPTQLLSHSSLVAWGRERMVKVKKVVGWNRDHLIGKAKAAWANKAKQGLINYFPLAGRCSTISRKAKLHQT